MTRKLYETIATLVQARHNCHLTGNDEWLDRHTEKLEQLVGDYLPSGSGFDNGTQIDLDASSVSKLVFNTAFHHMNDVGMYDGWTEHTVTVTADLTGICIKVSGRNKRDIKDYIAESFHQQLTEIRDL